ncbi:MAG: type II toxin-antitoxin system VapC family toxin [Desulfococcaceae bacterium]
MKFLFDSDMVNILYDDQRKAHHESLHRKMAQLSEEDSVLISVLVLYELEYSFFNAPDDKKEPIRNTICSAMNDFDAVLPLDADTAPIFGEIKAMLKKMKGLSRKEMRKHNIDIMLAGTAICASSVLIGSDSIYADIAECYPMFRFEKWI